MGKNTLSILRGHEIDQNAYERIIIYARAGIGKTRFGLSLTPRFGKIAYYAADKNSWLLQSISAEKRKRVVVVKPEGDDPTALFMQFCMTDWSAVDSEIKTLVVDTYTKVAMDAIAWTANTNAVDREKHYIIGEPGEGGIAIPNRGDYQAIDGLSKGFLDMLFDKQSDKHIIFLCHEEVKTTEGVHSVGGPQHPGRQMIDYLPAQFSTVIRLVREEVLVPGADNVEPVVVAITDNDGRFVAKLRTEDEDAPNPMGRVVLDRDPVNFWKQYDKNFVTGEIPTATPKSVKKGKK